MSSKSKVCLDLFYQSINVALSMYIFKYLLLYLGSVCLVIVLGVAYGKYPF